MAEPKVVFRRTIDGVSDFLRLDENLYLWEKKEGDDWKFVKHYRTYAEVYTQVRQAALLLGYEEVIEGEKE